MPRMPRLDAPGVLHHVMVRGIEQRNIFRDNRDRENFLGRLGKLLQETQTACYAWALLPDHAHFLFRTGHASLPTLMRRLLTGYVVSFNHRYQRHGHLFQNRYKSIVCQEDLYFQELVRYIHLNPVRAGIVQDFAKLNSYSYSGHSTLMGKQKRPWQDTEYVLLYFGESSQDARNAYLAFVEAGLDQGHRRDLTGGGWRRSLGGWSGMEGRERTRDPDSRDERILGDSDFVDSILAKAEEKLTRPYELKRRGLDLEELAERVAEIYRIEAGQLFSRGRHQVRVQARDLFCFWAARELGLSLTALARRLGMSPPAVGYAAQRGEVIAREKGYRLTG